MFEKKNAVRLHSTSASVDVFFYFILFILAFFCTVVGDSEDDYFPIGLGSKRKWNTQAVSARRTGTMTRKLPRALSSSLVIRSAFPPPQPKSAAQPVRHRSAFPPMIPAVRPIQWTRSVDTTPTHLYGLQRPSWPMEKKQGRWSSPRSLTVLHGKKKAQSDTSERFTKWRINVRFFIMVRNITEFCSPT